MNADSIEDLTNEANQVITGQEPGAGQTEQVYQAMADYPSLNGWTQQTSSAGAMLAALADAYPKQEDIILSGWSPHWKFVEYDLKFLEDPRGSFGDGESIHTLVRQGLKEDNPRAYQILDSFEWDVENMQAVMVAIYKGENPQIAARNWIEANPERITEWTDIE